MMQGGRLPSLENMASNGEGLAKEREKASQKDQDVYGRGEGGSGENMTARRQRRARGKQANGQHATPRRDMTRSAGIRHRARSLTNHDGRTHGGPTSDSAQASTRELGISLLFQS